MARLWMKGQVTHADTGAVEKFNDAGELVSILGKWNSAKFREVKNAAKGSPSGA
jgi:predicted RNA methylase